MLDASRQPSRFLGARVYDARSGPTRRFDDVCSHTKSCPIQRVAKLVRYMKECTPYLQAAHIHYFNNTLTSRLLDEVCDFSGKSPSLWQ